MILSGKAHESSYASVCCAAFAGVHTTGDLLCCGESAQQETEEGQVRVIEPLQRMQHIDALSAQLGWKAAMTGVEAARRKETEGCQVADGSGSVLFCLHLLSKLPCGNFVWQPPTLAAVKGCGIPFCDSCRELSMRQMC